MYSNTDKAAKKLKESKPPGSCGVYPEYILHGDTEALRTLSLIYTRVWRTKLSQGNGTKV